jgi:DNA invertase Pin-like site-specific DNA recombinase
MFQMMGLFAEFERSMIRERVNAGIARAKVDGKHFGRPSMPSLRIASASLWLRLVPSQDRQAVRRRQRQGSTDRGRQLGG